MSSDETKYPKRLIKMVKRSRARSLLDNPLPQAEMVCPRCNGAVIGPEYGGVFCGLCGYQIGKFCPNGHAAPLWATYCPVCGKPLAEDERGDGQRDTTG